MLLLVGCFNYGMIDVIMIGDRMDEWNDGNMIIENNSLVCIILSVS